MPLQNVKGGYRQFPVNERILNGILTYSHSFVSHPLSPLELPHFQAPGLQNMSLVPPKQARGTLVYLSNNLNRFRASEDFHFKVWSPTFSEFVSALTAYQVREAVTMCNDALAFSFFADALNVFTPCLDAVGPNSPWAKETPAEGAHLISAFTNGLALLVRSLVGVAPMLGAHFVSETWRYVTQTLKTVGPGNLSRGVPKTFVQDAMLSSLATVPWRVGPTAGRLQR